MPEDEQINNADTPPTKKGGGKKILLLIALAMFFAVPILTLAVGIGIIPRGGSFNPLKASSTALAADVECLLKFPPDASPDDKLIGAVFDQYIKNLNPTSPMVGLGETISKSGRGAAVNPTIIVAQARNESHFGVDVTTATKGNNPFGRRNNDGSYIKFGSYEKAVVDHGPYLRRRYIDEGVTTVLEMMKIYAPVSDDNDPVGYSNKIGTWSAEMVQLAQSNYQGALGAGVCPLPSVQTKIL